MITLGSLTLATSVANSQGISTAGGPLEIVISVPEPSSNMANKREEAINRIVSSIAMEELALSHILNADGNKAQYKSGTNDFDGGHANDDTPIPPNDSDKRMLSAYALMQVFLGDKLSSTLDSDEYSDF
ncbi:MAG: hypothetical protein LBV08_04905 [Clostridiales bacterium]|jgi:hypothetical protein|nr:hypothetical protein [Clostridiales bacterium]